VQLRSQPPRETDTARTAPDIAGDGEERIFAKRYGPTDMATTVRPGTVRSLAKRYHHREHHDDRRAPFSYLFATPMST
jgi:hypothetical protein